MKNNKPHYIYHLKDIKKIGATQDLDKRVTDDQGYATGEYDIVATTNSLDYASDIEKALQMLYGYSVDNTDYKTIKNMKKNAKRVDGVLTLTQHDNTGNVGVNMRLGSLDELRDEMGNGVTFILHDKDRLVFDTDEIEDVIELAIESQYPTGDYYFRTRKLQILRDDLDMELGNQEMTAAHELWGMTQDELEAKRDNKRWRCGTPDLQVAAAKRQQNKCSDLEVENKTCMDLDRMFLMQKSLQQKFPETGKVGEPTMTLTEIATQAQRNLHCFLDEAMEYMDAIGGINDGVGNGAWKYWKKDNREASCKTLADLSDGDLKELQMEVVDMFHFFMNFALLVGMSGSDLFNMYIAKNRENFDRQSRGY